MFYDSEPSRDGKVPATTWDLVYAYKWYNENASDKDAAKYLNCDIVTAKRFLTLAWAERLLTRGFIFPEREGKTLEIQRALFKEHLSKLEVSKEDKPTINIQERTKQKAFELMEMFENKHHEWVHDKIAVDFNKFFESIEVKPAHVPYMLEEIKILQKDSIKDTFGPAIKALELIVKNKPKVERQPRKKKPIDPEKLVKDLKYLDFSKELNLKSIDAKNIHGSDILWTYNTKYRILGLIKAKEHESLSVKGSTIINISEESITKTLRKPEEFFKEFFDGTFSRRLKIFNEIKAKPAKITGRINKDVLLLKVENK